MALRMRFISSPPSRNRKNIENTAKNNFATLRPTPPMRSFAQMYISPPMGSYALGGQLTPASGLYSTGSVAKGVKVRPWFTSMKPSGA